METCVKCGEALQPPSRFCARCGTPSSRIERQWRWWGLVLLSICAMGVWLVASGPEITPPAKNETPEAATIPTPEEAATIPTPEAAAAIPNCADVGRVWAAIGRERDEGVSLAEATEDAGVMLKRIGWPDNAASKKIVKEIFADPASPAQLEAGWRRDCAKRPGTQQEPATPEEYGAAAAICCADAMNKAYTQDTGQHASILEAAKQFYCADSDCSPQQIRLLKTAANKMRAGVIECSEKTPCAGENFPR